MNYPRQLVITALQGVPQVANGDDLGKLILDAVGQSGITLQGSDTIVLAQKIVSKAEGRAVALSTVTPTKRALDIAATVQKDPRLVELILSESMEVMRTKPGVLIVQHRLGFVLANAGIDQSNVDHSDEEYALLLPSDPDGTAAQIRADIRRRSAVGVAVLIIDSIGRAWRNGTVGQCLGASGLPGLVDLRGRADLYGRRLSTSELGLADEIAAAASLMMGQAGEGTPIVHLRGLPPYGDEGNARQLVRPRDRDLFR